MVWSTGSVADKVYDRIDNISSSVSGNLLQLSEEARIDLANYLNITIANDNIVETYQPVLVACTMSSALSEQELEGVDASSYKLGDLDVKKGGDSNISNTITFWNNKCAILKKDLAKKVGRSITKMYKVNG